MEFKERSIFGRTIRRIRINRNIMEFKADIDISQAIEETEN